MEVGVVIGLESCAGSLRLVVSVVLGIKAGCHAFGDGGVWPFGAGADRSSDGRLLDSGILSASELGIRAGCHELSKDMAITGDAEKEETNTRRGC